NREREDPGPQYRIERFVSFTRPFDIIPNRRFLYYFSVYVNLFKELFSLSPHSCQPDGLFRKASAKV
ncbi:hypothetical protein, partial [Prevotella fusca]|uniref:hypothetical protein n=1 Tax=Prevotella fusca TaxID=589436 RepID=UPI001F34EE5F